MRLTFAQMSLAIIVANTRHATAKKNGNTHKFGTQWTWDKEIGGVCGELLVAQFLNLFWDGGKMGDRDVGGLVDVRQTEWPEGHLALHKPDPNHIPFVLVTGRDREFELRGWMFAHEGKQERWWGIKGDGDPAYYVPQDAPLHRMEILRRWVLAEITPNPTEVVNGDVDSGLQQRGMRGSV